MGEIACKEGDLVDHLGAGEMGEEGAETVVELEHERNQDIGRAATLVTQCRNETEAGTREKAVTAYGIFKKWYMGKIKTTSNESRKKAFALLGKAWTALSEEEKDFYQKQAGAMKEGARCEKKALGSTSRCAKKGQVVYYSRCVPQQVMRAVKDMEGKFHVLRLIRETGFESLCRVRCGNMPKKFIIKLLGHFDPMTCKLVVRGERASIYAEDVVKLMGVPGGPDPVPAEGSSIPKVLEAYERNRERKAKKPNFNVLRSILQTCEDEVMTKQAFLLLVLGSILCPTSSHTPSTKLYSAVADVSNLTRYNWGEFVLTWLCEEVRRFKLGERGRTAGARKSSVGGCMLFLLIFYFERFPFKNFETRPWHLHPLEFWDTCRVRRRVCLERQYAKVSPTEAIGIKCGEAYVKLDSRDVQFKSAHVEQNSGKLQCLALNLMAKHMTSFRQEFEKNAVALANGETPLTVGPLNEAFELDDAEGES